MSLKRSTRTFFLALGLVAMATADDRAARLKAWFAAAHEDGTALPDVPQGGVDVVDEDGRTALHWAAAEGREAKVRALLGLGAALLTRDGSGWTPLMSASSAGHASVVAALLRAAGSDSAKKTAASAVNDRGCSALHYACSKAHRDVVALLLDAGADARAKDAFGSTALHRAAAVPPPTAPPTATAEGAQPAAVAVVRLLLQRQRSAATTAALLEARNSSGQSALHVAVQMRNIPVVLALLDAGAATDTRDSDNNPPIAYAADDEMRELLLRHHPRV